MKLRDLLRGLLLNNVSFRDIVQGKLDAFESCSKWLAIVSVVCYALGVLITSLYFSGLSLRAFELLQPQYIFLGFFYIAFFYTCFIFPLKICKNIICILLFQSFAASIVTLNLDLVNYLFFLSGYSELNYTENAGIHIYSKAIETLILFFSTTLLLIKSRHLIYKLKQTSLAVVMFCFAIIISIQCFSVAIFPRISSTLGGGDFPVVRITFAEDTPQQLTYPFEISSTYEYYDYYGILIYSDESTVFLKRVYWYDTEVIEIPRSRIIQFTYTEYSSYLKDR
jgi:hypothetical protein